jgi:DNA-binding beta-propeller fold protein YncE
MERRNLAEAAMRIAAFTIAFFSLFLSVGSMSAEEFLTVEDKILLGEVAGRIDHLAVDLKRNRLFVAELGNNSVGVVDLIERKLIRRLSGLKEPQGVGYVASTDTLYVASAGDGSVRLFKGPEFSFAERIDLGEDADNIRIDNVANLAYVGFGNGAIAAIDITSRKKIGEIPLRGHPESFQLDQSSKKIWVNVPDAGHVAVLDRSSGKQVATWVLKKAKSNFPMAIDRGNNRILIVSRQPSQLIAFAADDGAVVARLEICGDADDIFVDEKRQRIYVTCGEGFIDILQAEAHGYQRLGRIPTALGTRTSLFVPDLDRLFVAVRATSNEPAAVWIFRPLP